MLFDIFSTAQSAVRCLTLLKQSFKVTDGQRADVMVAPDASKHPLSPTVFPSGYFNLPAGSKT
ncbi:hypothetical protein IKI14_03260 [bacterium]|nr:hypothetical protein [bacterium]